MNRKRACPRNAATTGGATRGKSTGNTGRRRPAFLLVLVMLVIAMASLAMLNFSRAMLISNETSQISNSQLQARMSAESGAQAVRLFLSYPAGQRLNLGGTWDNPQFQARNVMPSDVPQHRGNFTIVAPGLDEVGSYGGVRFGLQNESAKLNLNLLIQLDTMARSQGPSTTSDDAAGMASLGLSGANSLPTQTIATNMLLALPGMTFDVAEAILDWLDSDDTARDYGAEADYYARLQPPYQPTNGPIESIEQLLLVRGVTPQLLYGYDENRNGVLDPGELEKLSLGVQPGMLPGQVNVAALDPNYTPPPPLGLAAYLTVASQERNVALDGSPRININGSDLQQLYGDLVEVLGDEAFASFIVAYRLSGQPPSESATPLSILMSMAAGESTTEASTELDSGGALIEAATEALPSEPWDASVLEQMDLTQAGAVNFQQVLDLFDASISIGEGAQARRYASPFSTDPASMAVTTPILLDRLTTVDATAIPGRINIMECPREILLALPGLDEQVVDLIIAARNDGNFNEARLFETWLVVEGYLTLQQMRGLQPLITCGGDVYKAQIVGYAEGATAFPGWRP